MELQNIPTPENVELKDGKIPVEFKDNVLGFKDTGVAGDTDAVEDKAEATTKYDICNVEAIRKDGNPKIVALKIVSIEKEMWLTDDQLESLYYFDIHQHGQRAFIAGTRKAGDIQEL